MSDLGDWRNPIPASALVGEIFAELHAKLVARRATGVPVQGMFAFSMANGPRYGFADASEPRISVPVQPMQAVEECPVCNWIDRANPRSDLCPNCGEQKPLE